MKNVINLGILKSPSLLESGIKDRYYIYYKADCDLYLYNSFKEKEINLFRLGSIPKGNIDFTISKEDNGLLSFDISRLLNGSLSFEFNKIDNGLLSFSFTKIDNGTLTFSIVSEEAVIEPSGIVNVKVKEYN